MSKPLFKCVLKKVLGAQIVNQFVGLLAAALAFGARPCAAKPFPESVRMERYAALECQNDLAFAIVNFYSDQTLMLSWGQRDELIGVDIKVLRAVTAGVERYTGQGAQLTLPVMVGVDSTQIRFGELSVAQSGFVPWGPLRCLLFEAD